MRSTLLPIVFVVLCSLFAFLTVECQETPSGFVSTIVKDMINKDQLLPTHIDVNQGVDQITVKTIDMKSFQVMSLDIQNLTRPTKDDFSVIAQISVQASQVSATTTVFGQDQTVDMGTSVLNFSVRFDLALPCDGAGSTAVSNVVLTGLQVQNPMNDWAVQLIVSMLNKNSALFSFAITRVIPKSIPFPAPKEIKIMCLLSSEVAAPPPTSFASSIDPSAFIKLMLNNAIKYFAGKPLDLVPNCPGTLHQVNLCDSMTASKQSDAAAIPICQAGCQTAWGACQAGTKTCYGLCMVCKSCQWLGCPCDCYNKCGCAKCDGVRDSCLSSCVSALTWKGAAGLENIIGLDSMSVTNLSYSQTTKIWTVEITVSPTVTAKYMMTPVVPDFKTVSTGLGNWVVNVQFTMSCDGQTITGVTENSFDITGFNMNVISDILGALGDIPHMSDVFEQLNNAIQTQIYDAIKPQLENGIFGGLKSLFPLKTPINVCDL